MDYRSAGVDIDKGDRLVDRIKSMMGESGIRIGHFGGTIPFPSSKYRDPLLVSSIDSVGTKVKIAGKLNRYDTIGQDIVHHSINDIACCGAEPLAFLDYYAVSGLDIDTASEVIKGVITACSRWGVSLIGGEAAEMPGVYEKGEFDLVGSVIGVVERSDYIDGKGIRQGDFILGFQSNGLHTNGYSLARQVIETSGLEYSEKLPGSDKSIGEALLEIHICYLDVIRELKRLGGLKGLAHITGGGLPGNVRRILPRGLAAKFYWDKWNEPPIFGLIRRWGAVPEEDMRRTFNLGIGLVAIVAADNADRACSEFPSDLSAPKIIGTVENEEEC